MAKLTYFPDSYIGSTPGGGIALSAPAEIWWTNNEDRERKCYQHKKMKFMKSNFVLALFDIFKYLVSIVKGSNHSKRFQLISSQWMPIGSPNLV